MSITFFKNKEILNYILSKGSTMFFFRMIGMVFSFVTMWFITRFYGESVFGNYSLSLTVLQIIVMLFSMGIPVAFVSFSGEIQNIKKIKGLFFNNLKILLLPALIPVFLIFIFSENITSFFFNKIFLSPYFKALSLGIPFLLLHEIVCYYFMATKKFITYGLFIFIFPNVLFVALLLIFNNSDYDEYFSFVAYICAMALTALLGFLIILLNKTKAKNPFITTKVILKKSLPMMLSGIFLVLLNWTDILMLGYYETDSQIGIYNLAFKLGYLALFFVVSMNAIIMPKVSEYFQKNEMKEMKILINKATQVVILLTIPLAMILIIFNNYILSFFGEGFVLGKTTLILVTLGALYNAMTGNVDQILNMTNNEKIVRNVFIVGFIINVILNLLLIPRYGIEGAAISSLITNIVLNSSLVIFIKRKLGFYTFTKI